MTKQRVFIADRHDTGYAVEVQFEDCVKALSPDHGYHLAFVTEDGRVFHHNHTFPFGFGIHSGVMSQPEEEALERAEALLSRVDAAGTVNLDHWAHVRNKYASASWDEEAEVEREREEARW